jgi:prepilin-type N-terminal cleavage/methylation domain-containing protein
MNITPSSLQSSRRAFTLIELLTVIAIIAVLAGILIPVIGAVRSSANDAQGVSNLRQIGVMIDMFSTDNSNRFPPAVVNESSFVTILAPYYTGGNDNTYASVQESERSEVFKDPSAENQEGTCHFGANPNFMGDLQDWNDQENAPKVGDLDQLVHRLAPQRPAEQVIMVDATQMSNGDTHPTVWGVSGIWYSYSGGDSSVMPRGRDVDGSGGYLRWRAAGGDGIKCLFVDGHVSIMLEGELLKKHFQGVE